MQNNILTTIILIAEFRTYDRELSNNHEFFVQEISSETIMNS